VGASRADGTDAFSEAGISEAQAAEIEVFEGEIRIMGKVVDPKNPFHAHGEMPAPQRPGD
jgi:hypothetical protein